MALIRCICAEHNSVIAVGHACDTSCACRIAVRCGALGCHHNHCYHNHCLAKCLWCDAGRTRPLTSR